MLMCCQRGYVLRAPSLGTIAISGATLRQYQALRQNKTPLHFSNSSAYAIESTGTILQHGQVLQYCKSRCYAIAITCRKCDEPSTLLLLPQDYTVHILSNTVLLA